MSKPAQSEHLSVTKKQKPSGQCQYLWQVWKRMRTSPNKQHTEKTNQNIGFKKENLFYFSLITSGKPWAYVEQACKRWRPMRKKCLCLTRRHWNTSFSETLGNVCLHSCILCNILTHSSFLAIFAPPLSVFPSASLDVPRLSAVPMVTSSGSLMRSSLTFFQVQISTPKPPPDAPSVNVFQCHGGPSQQVAVYDHREWTAGGRERCPGAFSVGGQQTWCWSLHWPWRICAAQDTQDDVCFQRQHSLCRFCSGDDKQISFLCKHRQKDSESH